MQLYMKQKVLSLKQDFNIFDADQKSVYRVDGEFWSIGRKLHIIETATNQEVAFVQQKVLTLLPQVDVYVRGEYVTSIKKRLTFLTQKYDVTHIGWTIEGDLWAHDYTIYDREGDQVARITKKFFAMTDTYEFNIDSEEADPAMVIAVILAIDTVMDSNNY